MRIDRALSVWAPVDNEFRKDYYSMLVKTVKVTNPRNVLVQIPSFIIALWGANTNLALEVHYDEESSIITIKPTSGVTGRAE